MSLLWVGFVALITAGCAGSSHESPPLLRVDQTKLAARMATLSRFSEPPEEEPTVTSEGQPVAQQSTESEPVIEPVAEASEASNSEVESEQSEGALPIDESNSPEVDGENTEAASPTDTTANVPPSELPEPSEPTEQGSRPF